MTCPSPAPVPGKPCVTRLRFSYAPGGVTQRCTNSRYPVSSIFVARRKQHAHLRGVFADLARDCEHVLAAELHGERRALQR